MNELCNLQYFKARKSGAQTIPKYVTLSNRIYSMRKKRPVFYVPISG